MISTKKINKLLTSSGLVVLLNFNPSSLAKLDQLTVSRQDLTIETPLTLENIQITDNTLTYQLPNPYTPPVTPTPPPTPKPAIKPRLPQPAPLDLEPIFAEFANLFSIDQQLLTAISHCESRHYPGAINGQYGGLFQFATATWISTRNAMNHDPNPDLRFDPVEAIKTAAFKLANGGARAWANCLP